MPSTDDHASRLAAFEIGAWDIAALQRQRVRLWRKLPLLLDQLDWSPATKPEVTDSLSDETFKQTRDGYWQCIASGELDEAFVEAATKLAQSAYLKGIPSRTFAIRHSSGGRMFINCLFGNAASPHGTSWTARVIRRQFRAKRRAEYASALQKVLWLGLSIMLEAYSNVEAEAKSMTIGMIETSFSGRISSIADVLGTQVTALDNAVVSISASAEQSTRSADMLADDALKASRAVRDVSASTDELAQSVSYIGERIAQCAQSASAAAEQARLGDRAVAKFSDSTAAIDQIIALINQIADRTKLLALNATIEAARAGPAGRGFAVVASEVTNLAKETSSAISRVSQQVHLIRGSAQESSTAIHALAEKIGEVSAITSVIAASLLQQGAVTQEIAVSVKQAALGNEQVSKLMEIMKIEASRCRNLAGTLANAAAGIGLQGTIARDSTQTFMDEVHTAQRSNWPSRR